ncbi:hypothetical protein [Pseudoalteromonas phenolica]|uniref:hypothetical protein n=1 Tax=Pseudoalteromonas phenolica TaxID=161398 RepID=UPI0038514429
MTSRYHAKKNFDKKIILRALQSSDSNKIEVSSEFQYSNDDISFISNQLAAQFVDIQIQNGKFIAHFES